MNVVLLFVLITGLAVNAAPQDQSAEPELSDLAWLEGCWHGTGFGKRVDECWMRAPNGRLTGMFQMTGADGRQAVSEIFVLDAFEDGPALRLKHFHADLTGWEDKDEFIVFPLLETNAGFARFDGLTYRRTDQDRLVVDLTVSLEGEPHRVLLELERRRGRSPGM